MDILDYTFKYHKRGGHEINYILVNQETGATSYTQYVSLDGYWFIAKSVRTGAETAYTYTAPVHKNTTTIAAGWTARAAQTYVSPEVAFT
jgi:hypothetical protein